MNPATLPAAFEKLIVDHLGDPAPPKLAAKVLKLSDFYNKNVGATTPWSETFARDAYLSYFMPLNFARLQTAFQEVKRFLPLDEISEIWDIGSGSGVTHWVLENEPSITPRPFYNVESAPDAIALHRQLAKSYGGRWQAQHVEEIEPKAGALGVFSYSFLETKSSAGLLERFQHLLLVEPSVREVGRRLMDLRQTLIEKSFTPLAPCTHSQACPLLVHSAKDWCHHRVHFAPPAWWLEMENHLPMRNRTLTYSYLLASRSAVDKKFRGWARAIGDTLHENGKTKQAICRRNQREFLSWLHKKGEPEQIPHGALITGVEAAEVKGSELRPQPGQLRWEY